MKSQHGLRPPLSGKVEQEDVSICRITAFTNVYLQVSKGKSADYVAGNRITIALGVQVLSFAWGRATIECTPRLSVLPKLGYSEAMSASTLMDGLWILQT